MASAALANDHVGWVVEPITRGTASLTFNCISTVIICTYSALHLNVPGDKDSKKARIIVKVWLLVWSLIAPELYSYVAVWDWFEAQKITKLMRSQQNTIKWSHSLSFFLIMGGVTIRDQEGGKIRLPPDQAHVFINKGWFNPEDLSIAAMEDKSKATWFSKTIASIQITWFFSQLIGRAISHLPITTLELVTLAYIVCGLWAFGLWWHKPFDVQEPLLINANPSFTQEDKQAIIRDSYYGPSFIEGKVIPLVPSRHDDWKTFPSIVFPCALFGIPHLLGWNALFPTSIEQLLWRIGSVCCVGLPLIIASTALDVIGDWERRWEIVRYIQRTLFLTITVLYCFVRIFLLVEAFVALRSVSPDVYAVVRWSQYIPHIG